MISWNPWNLWIYHLYSNLVSFLSVDHDLESFESLESDHDLEGDLSSFFH